MRPEVVNTANRIRNLRARAKRLGLVVRKTGGTVSLSDGKQTLVAGDLATVEGWVAERFVPRRPGPEGYDIPELWRPCIEMFLTEMRAAKRSAGTIECRLKRLLAFAHAHPGSDPLTVTRHDLVRYLSESDSWTPEYAHSVRTSLRVFFGLLVDLEIRTQDDPARRLPRIRIPRGIPRPCPDGAVRAALDHVTDRRLRLAIRLGAEAGLRRMEIASLRRDDVEGWPGEFRIHLRGKGGHERTVPIADDLALELRSAETVHIFPAPRGGHITPRHLGKMVAAALPDNWTAHTLRHRYATAAYAATCNLRAVQELLGHQSPATTAVYTKVADATIREAAMAARLNE